MTCAELLAAMNEYVEGTLDPGVCEGFEAHLAGCRPCAVVVDNIRQTVRLFKAGEPYPLPPAFSERLRGLLRAKWKETMGV